MSQQLRSNQKRDNSIDIARGIAIIGVLYGHSMAWQDIHGTALTYWFWSFHMALFAIVSGYFYKEKSFWDTFVSSVKSLLVPLFLVSFIMFFMDKMEVGVNDRKSLCVDFIKRAFATVTLQVDPPGFWFVIALFNCRIILAVVSKLNYKYKYLFLLALSIFVFVFPKHLSIFHISYTFGLMVFVIIGIYAKKYSLLNMPVNKVGAIVLAIILLSAGLFFVDIWRYYMPLYIFNFFTASIISYALLFYCKQLDQLKTNLVNPIRNVLAFCGRHSLMILSIQAILGQRFILSINHYVHIQNVVLIMIIFIFSCVVFTFILNGCRIRYTNVIKNL